MKHDEEQTLDPEPTVRDMIVTCWPARYFQNPRQPWVEIYHYGLSLMRHKGSVGGKTYSKGILIGDGATMKS